LYDVPVRDPTIPDGASMSEEHFIAEMQKLRKYAEDKELNLTHTFKGSGGKTNGIISKPRFKTALGMAFHQFQLTEEFISACALRYGTGPPDIHGGGYQEVLWRTFVIELRMNIDNPTPPSPPNPFDPRIAVLMSELRQIAEDSGLAMVHAMQGAGGQPTGVIAKQKFFMAMTSLLFTNYHFSQTLLNDVALIYANTKGPPDLRLGGYQEVLWRQFVIDIRKVPLPSAPVDDDD